MANITFLNPHFLWLLLTIPLAFAWYFYNKNNRDASLKISSIKSFKNNHSLLSKVKPLLFYVRLIALALMILALARPRTVDVSVKQKSTSGIDIVMAIDVSGSMLAKDLKPNRLDALKKVASKFANDRVNDRIGIVVYAGESYTKTPVTSDALIVQQAIKSIEYDDSIIQDGTGIGVGLATAVNRLRESKAKSRIIILLTDGVNNSGTIDPRMAADIAKKYGIKVYTIGLGTNGRAMFPYAKDPRGKFLYQMMDVEIDEGLMKEIAKKTDGIYYRATSNEKLQAIYDNINTLEKTEIKEKKFTNYNELFRPLLLLACGLLLIEVLLRNTILRGFI
ncbi:MAG: Ca-activated chloride channel family protein [Flavobacterium sp.]|jgi:Ca-activated chloride channel family protein